MEGCEGERERFGKEGKKEREKARLSTNKQRSLAYAFVPNPHDGRVKNTLNATQTAICATQRVRKSQERHRHHRGKEKNL